MGVLVYKNAIVIIYNHVMSVQSILSQSGNDGFDPSQCALVYLKQ